MPDVEAALQTRDEAQRPEQYLDPVSLGGLIVSVASLAWTVYKDLRSKTAKPSPDVVERTVRVELRSTEAEALAPAERDRIIKVVVSETVGAADKDA